MAPKLLFLISEDWYFQLHFLEMAKAAVADGYDVAVACRLGQRGHKREAIEAAGIRVLPLQMERTGLNPFQDIWTLGTIYKLYRREKPDIVHHIALKPIILGQIAAILTRIPARVNMMTGLGFVFTSPTGLAKLLRPIVSMALRLVLGRGNHCLVGLNSEDIQILADLSGVAKDRTEIIEGTGVNLDRFHLQPLPESDDPVEVGVVCRMMRDKGIFELIDAAHILKDRNVPVKITLAGEPDPSNPSSVPEKDLKRWAADGLVDWRGFVDDVPGFWRDQHISVLPSYGEGFGMSLAEAAASGRPLIATDVPGCRSVVRPDETGILIAPYSPQAIADAIEALVSDKSKREEMGKAARRDAEIRLAQEPINEAMLKVYRRLRGAKA